MRSVYKGLMLMSFIYSALCSLYDPHPFPSVGPFSEGWYIRLFDTNQNQSYGFLFGRVLPGSSKTKAPVCLLTFLKNSVVDGNMKLEAVEAFPSLDDVSVTVRGKPVTQEPDINSPADFKWSARGNGYFHINEINTIFNFTIKDIRFSGTIGQPLPWDPNGKGPEGWLVNLPLPLHWFVYSLASPVYSYSWTNTTSRESFTGKGTAHMEKNWGLSFPDAWIWFQSSHPDIHLSGVIGPVKFGPLPVQGHLIGYRNNNINLNFRPDNSVASLYHDGCNASSTIEVTSLFNKMHIEFSSDLRTYSKCLYGLAKDGFEQLCAESFTARANVYVYEFRWFKYHLIDKQHFEWVALEFGGEFSCNKTCTPEKSAFKEIVEI